MGKTMETMGKTVEGAGRRTPAAEGGRCDLRQCPLCAGAPPELRQRLRLSSPDKFHYLKHGFTGYFTRGGHGGNQTDAVVDDVADWARLDAGLASMGMSDGERTQLYECVAGLLHLGNVSFEEDHEGTRGGCVISAPGMEAAGLAAGLLGLSREELSMGLTSRVMQATRAGAKGTVIRVPLKTGEAAAARDALAKAVYARLFDHLVAVINASIPFNKDSKAYIGVLDIAGFEYFTVNGFEQFCINYCNEKLQQFFNDRILKQEQELYEVEGLGVKKIDYIDNSDCIELIEEKPDGILDMIDEESKLPRSSALNLTAHIHKRHKGHFRLESRLKEHRELRDDEGLLVRHFAGAVCYTTALFLEKNNDALHLSLELLLADSKTRLLSQLFQPQPTPKGPGKGGKLSLVSVGSKFRAQLKELMLKLEKGGTHFVRCIKPNSSMVAGHFEGAQILSQLQCSGMGSVLALMQQGFPSRTLFKDLYAMYRALMPPDLLRLDPRLFCKCLFKALGLNNTDFKFGLTKVFFRPGKFAEFDQMMRADPAHLVVLVGKVKKWLLRIRWKKAIWGALSVIKLKNKIAWRRSQLVLIQSRVRGFLAKRKYGPKIAAMGKVRTLSAQLAEMSTLLAELQNQGDGRATVARLEADLGALVVRIREKPLTESEMERAYRDLLKAAEGSLGKLKAQAASERAESVRLKELEAAMAAKEVEEAAAAEATRRMEAERAEKGRLEKERRAAEASATAQAALVAEQERLFEAQERERRQKLEQETRDRQLAQRLANESGNHATLLDEPTLPTPTNGQQPNSQFDLSMWKYADLRDVINTSNDISMLQACKNEFHRRLAGYQKWRAQNQAQPTAQRAPDSVVAAGRGATATATAAAPSRAQRFFRVPFSRPADRFRATEGGGTDGGRKAGLWWAHFDGPWIARQMEVLPERQATLLLKGRDDTEMCEMQLEATGLARKRGAEILGHEFEAEWHRHGGPAYALPSNVAPPRKPFQ